MKSIFSFWLLIGLSVTSLSQAATLTAQGTLVNLVVQPSVANAALQDVYIALSPAAEGCNLGLMQVPNASTAYGRAVMAAALTAQSAGSTVSVTYDSALNCKISQFAVVTP